ncbi:MAG TPA: hypothetical protein VFP97_02680 [Chitinophagaceae bacterium]|nr:hypothetical protein [Chitinophagaceae bacterium]
MKKVLVLVAALLVCFVVTAQDKRASIDQKSAFSINIGPSLPVGDFESTNEDNPNAGFAKTGFNFNLNYDYKFIPNVGLGANVFYGFHNIQDELLHNIATNSSADHYQYVGVLIGPMFSGVITPKTNINFRLMGGVARSNSPEFVLNGATFVEGDWASAFAWKLDGDVRFSFSKNAFFMLNVGYLQTRPDFKVNFLGEIENAEIHVSVINLNAGVGIKF